MSNVPSFMSQFSFFSFSFNTLALNRMRPELAELLEASGDLADAMGNFADKFEAVIQRFGPTSALCQCAPVAPPEIEDCCHPAGSLRTEGDSVVTTPGGYRIEMIGQYEWKITGPDGKSTRVWGDPHVDEGDGGKWDFKRDSTFVLGDGTRINVTTVPAGNGTTVTGSLEIISGGESVTISDIDKGKGVIGEIGYHSVDDFTGDVIMMGDETDDWSFRGREIIGSENGGETFKFDDEFHTMMSPIFLFDGARSWATSLLNGILREWPNTSNSSGCGYDPYSGNDRPRWEDDRRYDRRRHVENMSEALYALGDMFHALSRLMSLSDQLSVGRNRYFIQA